MKRKNMTVKELIAELRKYESNQRVWISKDDYGSPNQRVSKVDEGYVTMFDDVIIS